MSDARVSPDPTLEDRVATARARFEADGVNVSEWARERSFPPKLVHQILRGDRPCRRGQSHRIAVELGIKSALHAG